MYMFILFIILIYITTGIIKNIWYIIDYCDRKTEKQNEELKQRLRKLS